MTSPDLDLTTDPSAFQDPTPRRLSRAQARDLAAVVLIVVGLTLALVTLFVINMAAGLIAVGVALAGLGVALGYSGG